MQQITNKNIYLIKILIVIYGILLYFNITKYPNLIYAILLLSIGIFFYNYKAGFLLLFMTSFSSDLFSAGLKEGSLSRYLAILFIIFYLIDHLYKKGYLHIKHITKIFSFLLIFIFINTLLSCVINGIIYIDNSIFSLFLNFLIFLTILNCDSDEIIIFHENQPFIVFIISILLVMLTFFYNPNFYNISRLSVSNLNTNQLAIGLGPLLLFSIHSFLYLINIRIKSITYISMTLLLIMLFLTYSRTNIFSTVVCSLILIIYFIFNNSVKISAKIRNLIILAITLFSFFSYIKLNPIFYNTAIARFNYNEIINSGMSGRIYRYETYTNYFIPNYPFFGIGFGSKYLEKAHFTFFNRVMHSGSHNEYLEILTSVGIIGFIFYLIFFLFFAFIVIKAIRKSPSKRNILLLYFAIFIQFLFVCIGENPLLKKYVWICMGIGLNIATSPYKK